MRNDCVKCNVMQTALREGRELTKDQFAHIKHCDTCVDVWLTLALEEKPEVSIPGNFAARVGSKLPACPPQRAFTRRPRHWGLGAAAILVAVLMVVCFAGPTQANSWVAPVFLFLVTAEIAGLALWLAPKWTGR
jgi:hypothetical protein